MRLGSGVSFRTSGNGTNAPSVTSTHSADVALLLEEAPLVRGKRFARGIGSRISPLEVFGNAAACGKPACHLARVFAGAMQAELRAAAAIAAAEFVSDAETIDHELGGFHAVNSTFRAGASARRCWPAAPCFRCSRHRGACRENTTTRSAIR